MRRSALLVVCFFALGLGAFGQDLDEVVISGRVVDTNGQAIAGATVTARQTATGQERTATTNSDGRYRLIELPPGPYTIRFAATGFGAKERVELNTISGQNLQLDIDLSPADVQAETTVTVDDTDAPVIDTTRTIVGGTIEQREIEELPNIGRNPLDLVLTLGGTSEEALSTSDLAEDRNANPRSTPLEQGNFTIGGGASYSNNITIDGLDNNDDRSARDRFQPSLEAIEEVQVIRNQFSAEYGRASGGRINLRTRAGGNKFRGRAFMFYRDDRLNANTWYNNSRGIDRLPLKYYNPGFTLGGPVILPGYNGRNRTFFFAAYEYQRFDDTTLIDTYIPVVPNPNFQLPTPTGTEQFCDNANPSNCPATAGFVQNYQNLYATPNAGNIVTARVDHRFTNSVDVTVGWQFGRRKNRRTSGASTTRIEDALQARNINTDAINFTNNWVIRSNAVNQFRFQWSNYKPSYQTDDPLAPVILIGYRNPVTSSVQTLIAGNSTASSLQNFADSREERRLQFQNTTTYIAGRHTFKFGADIQDVNSQAVALGDATGTYNFSSVLNYSNNVVTRYRQNFGTATDVTNTYWGVFFNDEWKARDNLTINFGLRYENETAIDDKNNFGPRLGVAWDPFGRKRGAGRTVVRFGAGMFYNRVLLRTVGDFIQNQQGSLASFDSNLIPTTNNARNNVLARISQDFPNGYASLEALRSAITAANCGPVATPVPCTANTGFRANTASGGNPLRSIDPNLRIPESYQFNVGFEREVARGWVVEANYTWNKTVKLWREYNINLPVLPSGFSDYTAYLLANDFQFTNTNGSVRTYRFYMGPTTDASGVSTNPATQVGTCSTSATVTCWINLNTTNTSTAIPNTNASDGVSSNSIGGPIGIAKEALRHLRPDPSVDEKERVASIGNSFYQGLVVEFRRRYRKIGYGFGGSFRAVYTLSKLMDDGLNNTSNAEISGDFSREWARALQDRRHRFALSGTIETPKWFGKLRFAPVFRFGSSAPFNLGYGIDRNLNDSSTDRVIFNGDIRELVFRKPGSGIPTDLLAKFSLQPIGAPSGNIPRNAGRGPRQYIFDLNVTREFRFGERFRLRPVAEFGNILNMAVFSYGSEFVDFLRFGPNPTANQLQQLENFLVPTRTYRPRQIRLGIRFDF